LQRRPKWFPALLLPCLAGRLQRYTHDLTLASFCSLPGTRSGALLSLAPAACPHRPRLCTNADFLTSSLFLFLCALGHDQQSNRGIREAPSIAVQARREQLPLLQTTLLVILDAFTLRLRGVCGRAFSGLRATHPQVVPPCTAAPLDHTRWQCTSIQLERVEVVHAWCACARTRSPHFSVSK
jgi:hypothetical protein